MCMLNNYLNKYTEKLSRGDSKNPNQIKLDQNYFQYFQNGVEKATINPLLLEHQNKIQTRKMNKKILMSENPRYMTNTLK